MGGEVDSVVCKQLLVAHILSRVVHPHDTTKDVEFGVFTKKSLQPSTALPEVGGNVLLKGRWRHFLEKSRTLQLLEQLG